MVAHSKCFEQYEIDAARILAEMLCLKTQSNLQKVKRLGGRKSKGKVQFASKPKTILFDEHFINTLLCTNNDEIFSQAELEEINAIENGLRNL